MSAPPVVLSIAATDSGGGAGLAADLATFAALGVHGACVVTAVTAQDTLGVRAIHPVPLDIVAAQLDAVLEDLRPAVVKTGVLAAAEVVRLVAERCAALPLVVDPVLRATTGARFADPAVLRAYRDDLLPVASVITPNAAEAAVLLDRVASPRELAADLATAGPAVLTGGHDGADDGVDDCVDDCVDWLAVPGRAPQALRHPRICSRSDHGTGCTFSAALAAHLALGRPLAEAVRRAADFTAAQLRVSSTWTLGRGRGPIAHTTGGAR